MGNVAIVAHGGRRAPRVVYVRALSRCLFQAGACIDLLDWSTADVASRQ